MEGFTSSAMAYLEVFLFSLMLLYPGHFLPRSQRSLGREEKSVCRDLEWQELEHA